MRRKHILLIWLLVIVIISIFVFRYTHPNVSFSSLIANPLSLISSNALGNISNADRIQVVYKINNTTINPSAPTITQGTIVRDGVSYDYKVNNSLYTAYFRNNSNTAKSVRFEKNSYFFIYDISGEQMLWVEQPGLPSATNTLGGAVSSSSQNTQIRITNSTATYPNGFSNTNVSYNLNINRLKETYRLSFLPSIKNYTYLEYTGHVYFNASLKICANNRCYIPSGNQDDFNTTGRIEFKDNNNITQFFLERPIIKDNAGNITLGTYFVRGSNAQMVFELRIPTSFINKTSKTNATGVFFPNGLFIDPTVAVNDPQVIILNAGENITIIVSKNVSGNFNTSINNYLFASWNSTKWKYGLNDTSELNPNAWNQYRIEATSILPFTKYDGMLGFMNGNQFYRMDFSDICSVRNSTLNQSANCKFSNYVTKTTKKLTLLNGTNQTTNVSLYHYTVTYYGHPIQDPTISQTTATFTNTYNYQTQSENNFTHLEISNTPPYDSLVSYWSFDADNNITSYDLTNNNNDGAYTGTVVTSTGIYGTGSLYDGGSYISIPDSDSLDLTTNLTISGWIKTANNCGVYQACVIFSHADSGSFVGYMLAMGFPSNPGELSFWNGAGWYNSGTAVNDDAWHYVAATYDGTTLTMYVDGTNIYSNAISAPGITTNNAYIGAESDLNWKYTGTIDDLMVFNTTLNDTQIADIYNNQSVRFYPTGTTETSQFNITYPNNYNQVNLTLDGFQNLLGTNISARIGYWNPSNDYNTSDLNTDLNGLLIYYNLDNNSNLGENDTYTVDREGLVNGTVSGGAISNSNGVYGSSYIFDGVDGIVNINGSNGIDLPLNGNEVTFSAWINFADNSKTYQGIMEYAEWSNTVISFGTDPAGGGNDFGISVYNAGWNRAMTTTTTAFNNNQWYFVTGVYNQTDLVFYINGVPIVDTPTSITLPHNSNMALWLGKTMNGNSAPLGNFNGNIDEVMMFNRSLSQTEINQLYVKGRANWQYTDYQNLTDTINPTSFTIPENQSNILPSYLLSADTTYNFYTPYLQGNSIFNFDTIGGGGGDTTPPQYFNLTESPDDPTTYSFTQDYTFNATWTDDISIDTVILSFNGTNYTIIGVGDIYSKIFPSLAAGIYSYYWYANDTSGNTNQTDLQDYTINKAIPTGSISLAPATTNTYPTQTTATGSETNDGDNDIVYSLYRNGISVSNPEIITLAVGVYNYTYNSTEGENYSSTTSLDSKLLTINQGTGNVDTYINNSRSNIIVEVGTNLLLNGTLVTGQFGSLNLTQDGVQLNYSTTNNLTYIQTFNILGVFTINTNYSGNTNYTSNNENWTVTVQDTTKPLVYLISPTNTSSVLSFANFVANHTDNYQLKNTTLYLWNSTNALINTNTTNLSGLTNSSNLSLSFTNNDIYHWNYYTCDISGNCEFNNSVNFTITYDNINPIMNYVSPTSASGIYVAKTYIEINVTASDALVGLSNILIRLYNSTGQQINLSITSLSPNYINFSGLVNGIYYYNASANDTFENTANLPTRNITLDTINPIINIIYPLSGSNYTLVNHFNITSIDSNLNSCWYSFDNGGTNFTYTCNTDIIGLGTSDGIFTWTAYANDSVGNQNSTTTTFIVDPYSPIVNWTSPTTAASSYEEITTILANISANGGLTPVDYIRIRLYNSTGLYNESIKISGQVFDSFFLNFSALPFGTYTLEGCANDTVGNGFSCETNRTIVLSADITRPQIQFVSPTDVSGAFVGRQPITNVTASDLNFANITINFYNASGLVKTNTSITSPFYWQVSGLADGLYYFNATATDTYNNQNSTETRNITIDTTPPVITMPCPVQNNLYNGTVCLNVSAIDALSSIDTYWYNVFASNTGVNVSYIGNTTFTPNTTINIGVIGSYFINIYVNDTEGNTGSILDRFIHVTNISQGPPGVNGTGINGTNGNSSYIYTFVEPSGTNCSSGGYKIITTSNGVNSTAFICNGGSGQNGSIGLNGSSGNNGSSVFIYTYSEPVGTNCTNSGIKVIVNSNNTNSTSFICNGLDGSTGAQGVSGNSSYIYNFVEPSGSNCTYGGTKLILTSNNINTTIFTCNGQPGVNGTNGVGINGTNGIGYNGTNGYNSLINTTIEIAGTNCTYGGIKISSGQDINNDNFLNNSEVTSTSFVCNGVTGSNSTGFSTLINTSVEPSGSNCSVGGSKIDIGLDLDNDNILNASEITSTIFVCNGINGGNQSTSSSISYGVSPKPEQAIIGKCGFSSIDEVRNCTLQFGRNLYNKTIFLLTLFFISLILVILWWYDRGIDRLYHYLRRNKDAIK